MMLMQTCSPTLVVPLVKVSSLQDILLKPVKAQFTVKCQGKYRNNCQYIKTCLKRSLKNRQTKVLEDKW